MRFGTWPEDRHAKTLQNFCRERPKTDRLAPDSFFGAGLTSFSREEIQSGGDRSVFFSFATKICRRPCDMHVEARANFHGRD